MTTEAGLPANAIAAADQLTAAIAPLLPKYVDVAAAFAAANPQMKVARVQLAAELLSKIAPGITALCAHALLGLTDVPPTSGHPKTDELVRLARIALVEYTDRSKASAVLFLHLHKQPMVAVTGVCADALLRLASVRSATS